MKIWISKLELPLLGFEYLPKIQNSPKADTLVTACPALSAQQVNRNKDHTNTQGKNLSRTIKINCRMQTKTASTV